MTYRLDQYLPLAAGLVNAWDEQLRLAVTGLEVDAADFASGVHDARKALKRVRSLLLFGSEALGPARYELENAAMRDLSRLLAPFREADALLEIFDKMVDKELFPSTLALAPVRGRMVKRQGRAGAASARAFDQARRIGIHALSQAQERLRQWRPPVDCAPLFARSLRRAFVRAQRHRASVEAKPTTEALHEWRKDLKHCWYMSELLAPAWPLLRAPPQLALARMAEWLGECHDLAMLDEVFAEVTVPRAAADGIEGARAALAARQEKVQERVFKMARATLDRTPRRVVKTLRELWICAGVPVHPAATVVSQQIDRRDR